MRKFQVAWEEVASVERGDGNLEIHCRNGRKRRVPLGRLDNGDEVARALLSEAAGRGLATS